AAHRLRRAGLVPAVIYAKTSAETLKISRREIERLVAHAGTSRLIRLSISRGGKVEERPVLIKEVQRDPVKEEVIHVDFQAVAMDKPIHTHVPVHLAGVEKRQKEGVLVEHLLHEIEISCLPGAIPEAITVDVADLPVGESIHVRDLAAPAGVKILTAGEEVVVTVALPAAAEAAPAATEAAEPEVVAEKKEEK
ncbi:MAG: 50S ribosomal protein L25, partial [Firmicutes bacterium]|nr:50S ribosomal protein L25 [Bacillota bacterium]